MTIGTFKWEKGSINDNIRKLLKEIGFSYQNTFNGDIITSYGKVNHRLIDAENELYEVYL